jgi:hypothetical protein
LSDEPVLRSGREETYAPGKDTGRYWEAGASNVHWLIAAENQIEAGIKLALERVSAEGVFVEGNSFTEFVDVDALIMTLRESDTRIKRSAKRALEKTSALYVWRDGESTELKAGSLAEGSELNTEIIERCAVLPRYTKDSFSDLVSSLRVFNQSVAA